MKNIDSNLKFIKNSKKVMFAFFAVVFASILVFSVKKFKLGIDFEGGMLIDFETSHDVDKKLFNENIELISSKIKTKDFILQQTGLKKFILRIGKRESLNANEVKKSIKEIFQDVSINQIDIVGPQVSSDLVKKGFLSVFFSMFAIVIYLLSRFNFQFSISGVIVLFCDVIIAVGFVSLAKIEMNLTIIAAFLTIIGYCINDTVVLYDRIRYNMSSKAPAESVNDAISQMLRRSIITSFVTILSLLGVIIFSEGSIKDFAIVVSFGIVVGTIGSVFCASILPLYFGLKKEVKKKKEVKDKMFYAS